MTIFDRFLRYCFVTDTALSNHFQTIPNGFLEIVIDAYLSISIPCMLPSKKAVYKETIKRNQSYNLSGGESQATLYINI